MKASSFWILFPLFFLSCLPADESGQAGESVPRGTAPAATEPVIEEKPKLTAREKAEAKIAEMQRLHAKQKGEETRGAVWELLTRQAEALAHFEIDDWLDTFVPSSRAKEHEIFLRLRPLPFREVLLRPLEKQDQRPQEESEEQSDWIDVEMLYRLHDLPEDNPFIHHLKYRLEESAAGDLRVAEIVEKPSSPLPWRRSDFVLHRTNHFLILADPQLSIDLATAAGALETAWGTLLRSGFPMTSGYFVQLIEDQSVYARISARIDSLGVARWEYVQRGSNVEVHSRTFWINASWWSGRSPDKYVKEQSETLTHELIHLALADLTRPTTPPWMKEGAAVFFSQAISFQAQRQLVRRGLERLHARTLTERGVTDSLNRPLNSDEYLYSSYLVEELVRRHGGQKPFLNFYASFTGVDIPFGGSLGMPHGTRLRVTENLLQENYGISLDELDDAVRTRLTKTHR